MQRSGEASSRRSIGRGFPEAVTGLYLRQTPDLRLAMVVMTYPFETRLSGGDGGGDGDGGTDLVHDDVSFGIMVVGGGGAGAGVQNEGGGGGGEEQGKGGDIVLEEGRLTGEGPLAGGRGDGDGG